MRCINVLIADRCPVVVRGLKKVLGAQHKFKLVACCSDGMSCIEAIRSLRPDIAILDISMPGLTGLEILGSRAALTFLFKLFAAVSHTAICPALPPGFSFRMCVAWC
jgi:DNA-binding NarL/FixJ family response regulator